MQLDQHWCNALSGDSFSAGDSFQIRSGSPDPNTIAKVATQAGVVVDELYMCDSSDASAGLDRLRTAKLRLLTAALRRRPIFRPVIVASLSY